MDTNNSLTEFMPEQVTEFFGYLDTLRESGATNMYGAGSWLESAFSLERREARDILLAWMHTFSKEPASERANAAVGMGVGRIVR